MDWINNTFYLFIFIIKYSINNIRKQKKCHVKTVYKLYVKKDKN